MLGRAECSCSAVMVFSDFRVIKSPPVKCSFQTEVLSCSCEIPNQHEKQPIVAPSPHNLTPKKELWTASRQGS